jgi:hypothetical protein
LNIPIFNEKKTSLHNLTRALFAILFTIPFTFCNADGGEWCKSKEISLETKGSFYKWEANAFTQNGQPGHHLILETNPRGFS